MPERPTHVKVFAFALAGTLAGALWTMAQWLGEPYWRDNVLGDLIPMLVVFLALGAIAQRWLTAIATLALALAVFVGSLLAEEEYRLAHPVEMDGIGRSLDYVWIPLVVVAIPAACSLLGHWVAGRVRARRRPSPPASAP